MRYIFLILIIPALCWGDIVSDMHWKDMPPQSVSSDVSENLTTDARIERFKGGDVPGFVFGVHFEIDTSKVEKGDKGSIIIILKHHDGHVVSMSIDNVTSNLSDGFLVKGYHQKSGGISVQVFEKTIDNYDDVVLTGRMTITEIDEGGRWRVKCRIWDKADKGAGPLEAGRIEPDYSIGESDKTTLLVDYKGFKGATSTIVLNEIYGYKESE